MRLRLVQCEYKSDGTKLASTFHRRLQGWSLAQLGEHLLDVQVQVALVEDVDRLRLVFSDHTYL